MVDFDLAQIVGSHQVVQRYLEHLGHFAGLRYRHEVRIDHRHHRGDPVAGNRHEGIQIPQCLHLAWRQCDFFLAFAQCGRQRVAVVRFGAATGEADLATMRAQRFGTAGEDHLGAVGARHDTGQHRRFHRGPRRQQIDQFTAVPAIAGRGIGQRMQRAHQSFMVGQRAVQRLLKLRAQRLHAMQDAAAFVIAH